MIEVKLTFQNEDELLNFFMGVKPSYSVAVVEPTFDEAPAVEAAPPAPVESKKRGRKAVSEAQPAVADNTGSSTPAPDGDPSGAETAVTENAGVADVPPAAPQRDVTEDDIRKALAAYNAEHGMEKSRELLSKYGAARISEVKPEDRAAFLAEASV